MIKWYIVVVYLAKGLEYGQFIAAVVVRRGLHGSVTDHYLDDGDMDASGEEIGDACAPCVVERDIADTSFAGTHFEYRHDAAEREVPGVLDMSASFDRTENCTRLHRADVQPFLQGLQGGLKEKGFAAVSFSRYVEDPAVEIQVIHA